MKFPLFGNISPYIVSIKFAVTPADRGMTSPLPGWECTPKSEIKVGHPLWQDARCEADREGRIRILQNKGIAALGPVGVAVHCISCGDFVH